MLVRMHQRVPELWLTSLYIVHNFITRWATIPEPPKKCPKQDFCQNQTAGSVIRWKNGPLNASDHVESESCQPPTFRASPPVTLFYKNVVIAWRKCPKIIAPPVGPFDILVTLFRSWHAISEIKIMKIEWIACLFSIWLTHWSQLSESLE
jgi:hypothetical protein